MLILCHDNKVPEESLKFTFAVITIQQKVSFAASAVPNPDLLISSAPTKLSYGFGPASYSSLLQYQTSRR